MINVQNPETKYSGVLSCETFGKTRRRSHFEIVENNNGARLRVMKRQKKCMLALGWVRWTIYEDKICLGEALDRVAVPYKVERFNWPKSVPTAAERKHSCFVNRAF